MFLVERFFYIISDIAGLDKEILDVFEKRTYHEKEEGSVSMKRRLFLTGILFLLLLCSACGGLGSRLSLLNSDYKSETEAIAETEAIILEAVEYQGPGIAEKRVF